MATSGNASSQGSNYPYISASSNADNNPDAIDLASLSIQDQVEVADVLNWTRYAAMLPPGLIISEQTRV